MQHVFISDVHIGAFPEETEHKIEQDLLALIEYCELNHIQLHILGDLFDYWMEYPDYIPALGKTILSRFETYNRKNGGATYITGNHDNWTRGHFSHKGFNVEEDYADLTLDDKKVFMLHGDGLAGGQYNLSRPVFHRLLRSKWFVRLYQKLFPAEAGLHLMKTFSAVSRSRDYINPQRLNTWAESFLKKNSYDVVLSGHDHVPRVETFSFGTYINLGTFFHHRSAAAYTNGEFSLVTWDGEAGEFKPVQK